MCVCLFYMDNNSVSGQAVSCFSHHGSRMCVRVHVCPFRALDIWCLQLWEYRNAHKHKHVFVYFILQETYGILMNAVHARVCVRKRRTWHVNNANGCHCSPLAGWANLSNCVFLFFCFCRSRSVFCLRSLLTNISQSTSKKKYIL
jgi:hypothetical protein